MLAKIIAYLCMGTSLMIMGCTSNADEPALVDLKEVAEKDFKHFLDFKTDKVLSQKVKDAAALAPPSKSESMALRLFDPSMVGDYVLLDVDVRGDGNLDLWGLDLVYDEDLLRFHDVDFPNKWRRTGVSARENIVRVGAIATEYPGPRADDLSFLVRLIFKVRNEEAIGKRAVFMIGGKHENLKVARIADLAPAGILLEERKPVKRADGDPENPSKGDPEYPEYQGDPESPHGTIELNELDLERERVEAEYARVDWESYVEFQRMDSGERH